MTRHHEFEIGFTVGIENNEYVATLPGDPCHRRMEFLGSRLFPAENADEPDAREAFLSRFESFFLAFRN